MVTVQLPFVVDKTPTVSREQTPVDYGVKVTPWVNPVASWRFCLWMVQGPAPSNPDVLFRSRSGSFSSCEDRSGEGTPNLGERDVVVAFHNGLLGTSRDEAEGILWPECD